MPTNTEVLDEEEDFDLTNLTSEERAALLDSDDDEDTDADDESAPTQKDEGQEEEEGSGDEESVEQTDDEQDEAGETGKTEAAPPDNEPESVGASFEDRLAAIVEARRELGAQYDDGELDTSEYMDKREELHNQSIEINLERRDAKSYQDSLKAEAEKIWDDSNAAFFSANSDYNNSRGLRSVLQDHYNDVHNDPQFAKSSITARLNEAKRRSDAELGRAGAAPNTEPPVDTDAAKRAAMKGRGQESGKVRPGLSDIPAAAGATPESGGKYAHIDALEGTAQEVALSKLSESELDAWVASQD